MKDFEDLQESIAYWRDILQLNNYRIRVNKEPAGDPDALLCISTVAGRKIANIYVGSTFFDEREDEQEHAVVHELLHILTEQPLQVFMQMATGIVSSDLLDSVKTAITREMEYSTDHLADVIYELKPKKKGAKKKDV